MTFFLRAAATFALLITTTSANAAWHVATSTHFIVYADGPESAARDAAARLEKFQVALRFLSGATAPSSAVKIKVFLVDDPNAVEATLPFGGGGVLGYYSSTIRGPFTVMSRTDARGSKGSRGEVYMADMTAQQVLFHELTHHFSRQYFPAAYPTWYSEGFAEFVGSMALESNDRVVVGTPVQSRYASFSANDWLHVRKLLTAREYRDVSGSVHLLYAEGWLLVHYLTNTKARPGQLKIYLSLINKGVAFDDAARKAFGDLDKLNDELRGYSRRGKLDAMVLPFKKLDTGSITTRRLNAAEQAMLPLDIRLYSGIPAGDIKEFADRTSAAAGRYPADPEALRVLFEAQRLAGRTAQASETATRWAELAPDNGLAIAARADALADSLRASGNRDAAQWTAVRKLYADAAKKAPNEPRILHGFYETYAGQGVTPPESAQNALYTAFELLPQFDELRMQVARDFEMRGMLDAAIAVIRPEAYLSVDRSELDANERRKREAREKKYRVAGERVGETAREMLNRLEEKKAAGAK
jgi:hypothetical protein